MSPDHNIIAMRCRGRAKLPAKYTALVRQALSSCRIKRVRAWCAHRFGIGVHRARRVDLPPTAEEQELRKQRVPDRLRDEEGR